MKTAIEELIEEFKNIETLDSSVQVMILRGKAEELMTKEREQIESAIYNVLYVEMKENSGCVLEQEKDMFRDTAKDYYETTFTK